jgi:hypothetical protein
MYKIEKNIPLANIIRNGVKQHKYPFFEMKVGDSFAVPVDPATQLGYIRVHGRVRQAVANQRKRQPDAKFITRTIKAENIIRVWRVK